MIIYDVEAFEKRRKDAEDRWMCHQKQISSAYIRKVKLRPLCVGNLVFKKVGHVQKGLNTSQFAHKWE